MISYSDLKGQLKSGDIVLLKGFDLTGGLIMTLEGSQNLEDFTHVGIVMDLPAYGNSPAGLYYWQAAPPTPPPDKWPFGTDYIKQVECNGCVLVPLDIVVDVVANETLGKTSLNDFQLWARQLNKPLTAEYEQAMLNYMRVLSGRSFSYPVAEGMIADYTAGYDDVKNNGVLATSSADDTFFCSKLASQTFQEAGLLQSGLVTNSVLPGHFGQSADNQYLRFQDGYGFGDEIEFTVDS